MLVSTALRIRDAKHRGFRQCGHVAVDRDDLPEAGEGEYYWSDLEGLRVEKDRMVKVIGRVAYLLETGANDVLVVSNGER